MTQVYFRTTVIAMLLTLAGIWTPVCGQETATLKEQAEAAFQAQAWEKAVHAYTALVQRDSLDGQLWQRLGIAHYRQAQYKPALQAFAQAQQLGAGNLQVLAMSARAHAQLGDREAAFASLKKAVNNGLPPGVFQDDPKLAGLHDDTRFAALVARADSLAHPCKFDPRCRQFDFWVGEWDVFAGGNKVAESVIELLLDGCLIQENYQTLNGAYAGKSMNYFDVALGKWIQVYGDNRGRFSRYEGELRDGVLYFDGINLNRDGSQTLVRMRFTPLPEGKVRQEFEQSTDDGQTWSLLFDGIYVPKPL